MKLRKNLDRELGSIFSESLNAFDHIYLQDENSKTHFLELGVEEKRLRSVVH